MSTHTEKLNITDKHGFIYNVILEHKPHFGFSTALYNDRIIDQVELGKIYEPMGDDDLEWEQYHERLSEFTDEIKSNIIPKCQDYFNSRKNEQ